MRRATVISLITGMSIRFQSTLSMRRATDLRYEDVMAIAFQSTLSMRRATYPFCLIECSCLFQSTLSMRRATARKIRERHRDDISIHALHEESDQHARCLRPFFRISIHALHVESDRARHGVNVGAYRFQSTLSMRRATVTDSLEPSPVQFQSTLSMRRATQPLDYHPRHHIFQSTLSMRRATSSTSCSMSRKSSFQSTLSMRRATQIIKIAERRGNISIHALHEESDKGVLANSIASVNFNPRSP